MELFFVFVEGWVPDHFKPSRQHPLCSLRPWNLHAEDPGVGLPGDQRALGTRQEPVRISHEFLEAGAMFPDACNTSTSRTVYS